MKNFVYLILFFPFTLTAQRYISGQITDAENNEPVSAATVFISNTTVGTATDTEGYYRLRIPGEGSYQLTISHVGYQSVFMDIEPGNVSVKFDAALHIHELEEVAVSTRIRFRQKDINLFWKTVLGRNPSQRSIWVTNPESVYYYYNSETQNLKVTCREPLEIVNYETGYRIHYVLDHFTHDYKQDITEWSHQYIFTELEPENTRQKNNWEKKRQDVYQLSLAKFIKSLYNNSLYNDGFVLATLRQFMDRTNPYQITLLNPESILSTIAADNGRTLNLSDNQVMLVCYGRPVTENDLYRLQHMQSNNIITSSTSNSVYMNLLFGNSIRIFPDGTYTNQLLMAPVNTSNTLLGLNMMLPYEYFPEELTYLAMEHEKTIDFDSIAHFFDSQIRVFPQEKLHLHTDRDFYVPGEKIWFKAYLTDAATHQPATYSRYIYAELIDSRDSLVNRVMIRPENGMYYGHLPIENMIPEGNYTLRAYS